MCFLRVNLIIIIIITKYDAHSRFHVLRFRFRPIEVPFEAQLSTRNDHARVNVSTTG